MRRACATKKNKVKEELAEIEAETAKKVAKKDQEDERRASAPSLLQVKTMCPVPVAP